MKTKFGLAVIAAAALICFSSPSLAQSQPDSGSFEATYAKREVQPIAEHHILMLSESNGAAKSKGPVDGFSVNLREIADLNQGNGPQRGYLIFSKGGDGQVVRYEGTVKTVMKNGQLNVTMAGKYEVLSGSGALASLTGKGSYSGYFTAEDKFHVDWKGVRGDAPGKSAQK